MLSSYTIIGFTKICTTISFTLFTIPTIIRPLSLNPLHGSLQLRACPSFPIYLLSVHEIHLLHSFSSGSASMKMEREKYYSECRHGQYQDYQYTSPKKRHGISRLIDILAADKDGIKSLGLLHQGEELNRNGEIYIQKHPTLKTRIVDGSNLVATFVVNNTVLKGTIEVIIRGTLKKVTYGVVFIICQRGVRVTSTQRDEFETLNLWLISTRLGSIDVVTYNLTLSKSSTITIIGNAHQRQYHQRVWLVGDEFNGEEEKSAPTGSLFVSFSQLPPWMNRKELARNP